MNAEQTHTISQVGGSTAPEPVSKTSVGSAVTGYNMRCPAVKRLMREAAELSTPENEFAAHPTEANLFEWHFTIRGPEGCEFENGVYHGRIIFPSEYPMKPPSFILLTPNGRFQTEEKICLSISNYHPETWLPSWSIRTALVALRSFMTTPGNEGAIGSLNFSPEERKKLAAKSQTWKCHECGPIIKLLPDRQKEPSSDVSSHSEAAHATVMRGTGSSSSQIPSDKNDQKVEATETVPAENDYAKDSNDHETVTNTNSAATTDTDNQGTSEDLSTESNNPLSQQQQQNEPIKNIIYDFGIGCFVVLILALCLRRLLVLLLRL